MEVKREQPSELSSTSKVKNDAVSAEKNKNTVKNKDISLFWGNNQNNTPKVQASEKYYTIDDILSDDFDFSKLENMQEVEEDEETKINRILDEISTDKKNVEKAVFDNDKLIVAYKNQTKEVYVPYPFFDSENDENIASYVIQSRENKTPNGSETDYFTQDGKYVHSKIIIDKVNNTYTKEFFAEPQKGAKGSVSKYNYSGTDEKETNENTLQSINLDFKRTGGNYKIDYKVNRDENSNIVSVEKEEKYDHGNNKYSRFDGNRANEAVKSLLKQGEYKGFPDEKILLSQDGTELEKTKVKIGETGNVENIEKYNPSSDKPVENYSDFKAGKFMSFAFQKGSGNCYLLSTLNSLARSSRGQKILRDNLSFSKDENGQNVYTVKFPGAKIALNSLKSNLGEDNVFLKDTYTVTQEDIDKANRDVSLFSDGDTNVLIYEIAYSKMRDDVVTTQAKNNLPAPMYNYAGLENFSKMTGVKHSSEGGFGSEAEFMLTGIRPEKWHNTNKNLVKNIVNIDKATNTVSVITENDKKADSFNFQKDYPGFLKTADTFDTEEDKVRLLNEIIEDARDGVIDEHCMTASISVSYSGNESGAHQISIVNMNEDEVTFVDTNDERIGKDRVYKLSMEDFKRCATSFDIIKLK